jgi:hypothetical protein
MIKNVMGGLPQAWEIIFQMQRKMSNEKIGRKNKLSNSQNTFVFFFFFFFLDPSYFQSF